MSLARIHAISWHRSLGIALFCSFKSALKSALTPELTSSCQVQASNAPSRSGFPSLMVSRDKENRAQYITQVMSTVIHHSPPIMRKYRKYPRSCTAQAPLILSPSHEFLVPQPEIKHVSNTYGTLSKKSMTNTFSTYHKHRRPFIEELNGKSAFVLALR